MSPTAGRRGWTPGRLKDLVEFQRGFDITKAEQRDGPYPVISSSGTTSYHDEFMASGPGVILGRKGTVGSVHFSAEDYWPHDTTLWSKDLRGNDARYIFYFLQTIDLNRFDVGNSNPTLNRNHIHDLPILIPSRTSQRRIAAALSAYDELIENNRRRMALLEEAARQLYREWFVRLRFPGHEHTPLTNGLPQGWARKPLSACVELRSGGTPAKSRAEFWEGEIPWVSSGEMTQTRLYDTPLHISEEGAEAGSRMISAGTILAVVRGMSLAKEFRIAVATRDMAFNQDLKALECKPGIDSEYLFAALYADRERIRDSCTEASHGTKKLESSVLEAVPILVPEPRMQRLFRDVVDPMNAQRDNLSRQNEKLRAARDLLLPRLMSGEIAV